MGLECCLRGCKDGTEIFITVAPKSSSLSLQGLKGDRIKVKLTAAPVDGKANKQLIEYFAEILKLPKSAISIGKGNSSRNKSIIVHGVMPNEIKANLDGILDSD